MSVILNHENQGAARGDRSGLGGFPKRAKALVFCVPDRAGKVIGMNIPHQLSRDAVDDFKAIYLEEFGDTLSNDEAREIATRLLRFFGILANPGNGTGRN